MKELSKAERSDKTLKEIKYILDKCSPGKEAEAVLFAIQHDKITDVTWSK